MKPFKNIRAVVILLLLIGTAIIITIVSYYYPKYQAHQLKLKEDNKDILGDWKEYFVYEDTLKATAIRRFVLSEEGNLIQSYQYELGSQSRIWLDITDINYENGHLTIGNEFEGDINKSKDTIRLVYSPKSGIKYNLILDKLSDENLSEFLDSLVFARNLVYHYSEPVTIGDGLNCASILNAGMDTSKIFQLFNRIKNGNYQDIHSLLIWRGGNLVLEEYFASHGELSGPVINNHYRYKPHSLQSVTKSINSLVFGIALDKGSIVNVKSPLYEIFPDYSDLFDIQKRKITLENLLTMTTGLDWNELSLSYSNSDNDVNHMHNQGDLVKYCLAKPMVNEPGEKFNYNSGASIILGEIIKRKTGKSVDEYAAENLFSPLEINKYEWWFNKNDTNKVVGTAGGISLTSRDLLKIGILTLNEGTWNGEQVVSKKWIKTATSRQIRTGNSWYGYQWWIRDFTINEKIVDCFYAIGNGGKFLFVFPELNLIIVTTAENYSNNWSANVYTFIQKYILNAMNN